MAFSEDSRSEVAIFLISNIRLNYDREELLEVNRCHVIIQESHVCSMKLDLVNIIFQKLSYADLRASHKDLSDTSRKWLQAVQGNHFTDQQKMKR